MARKGSGTLEPGNPGILGEAVVSLVRGDTRIDTDVSNCYYEGLFNNLLGAPE